MQTSPGAGDGGIAGQSECEIRREIQREIQRAGKTIGHLPPTWSHGVTTSVEIRRRISNGSGSTIRPVGFHAFEVVARMPGTARPRITRASHGAAGRCWDPSRKKPL